MKMSHTPGKQPTHRRERRSISPAPQRRAALLVLLLLLLTACATTAEKRLSTEKLLVAAGFHYKEAENPQQMEKLRGLPQGQLIRHEINGKPIYVYALADACGCRFVGDESSYQRYLKLRRDAVIDGRMDKGAASDESVFSPDEGSAAVLDDLASGIIPGY
jgi:hypothetical protein